MKKKKWQFSIDEQERQHWKIRGNEKFLASFVCLIMRMAEALVVRSRDDIRILVLGSILSYPLDIALGYCCQCPRADSTADAVSAYNDCLDSSFPAMDICFLIKVQKKTKLKNFLGKMPRILGK